MTNEEFDKLPSIEKTKAYADWLNHIFNRLSELESNHFKMSLVLVLLLFATGAMTCFDYQANQQLIKRIEQLEKTPEVTK